MFCDSISDRKFIVLHVGEQALARAPVVGGFQKVVRKSYEIAARQPERRALQEPLVVLSLALENPLRAPHQAMRLSLPSLQ